MIPYFILGEETVMKAGPGLAVTLGCILIYAIYVNRKDREKVTSRVNVHKTDFGDYVVSLGGMWIPGAYETESAALESANLYASDLEKWKETYPQPVD